MGEGNKKREARTEELVSFLEFFRTEFDLPDIPVKRDPQKGDRYSFPVLPDFSKLSKLFSGNDELDFLYKKYNDNKESIKNFQEQKNDTNVGRLLNYLKYMKRQESKKCTYLTRTAKDKSNSINELTRFVLALAKVENDIKNVKYSALITKKIQYIYDGINEKKVERNIKDISCILQNINKGIFPGIFTEHECMTCLKFFTNDKILYFNDDVYAYTIPILRLLPDRNMSIFHAVSLNFGTIPWRPNLPFHIRIVVFPLPDHPLDHCALDELFK